VERRFFLFKRENKPESIGIRACALWNPTKVIYSFTHPDGVHLRACEQAPD